MTNAMQWQPWAGASSLPDNSEFLFKTIQHGGSRYTETTNWNSFEIGATDGSDCEIYIKNQPWQRVEEDGNFQFGRITHYAIITYPEDAA